MQLKGASEIVTCKDTYLYRKITVIFLSLADLMETIVKGGEKEFNHCNTRLLATSLNTHHIPVLTLSHTIVWMLFYKKPSKSLTETNTTSFPSSQCEMTMLSISKYGKRNSVHNSILMSYATTGICSGEEV